jgi:hypothetical protein
MTTDQLLKEHGDFLRDIAETLGPAPFTGSSLAMKNIYVPKGTTLHQFHAAGILARDPDNANTFWLAPEVLARFAAPEAGA